MRAGWVAGDGDGVGVDAGSLGHDDHDRGLRGLAALGGVEGELVAAGVGVGVEVGVRHGGACWRGGGDGELAGLEGDGEGVAGDGGREAGHEGSRADSERGEFRVGVLVVRAGVGSLWGAAREALDGVAEGDDPAGRGAAGAVVVVVAVVVVLGCSQPEGVEALAEVARRGGAHRNEGVAARGERDAAVVADGGEVRVAGGERESFEGRSP